MPEKNECDGVVIAGALIVFALPLTLLIPDFSLWDVVPKFRVTRFHIFSQHVTWPQLNALILGILILFFCLYLEIRKRRLDDVVEKVLAVSQATDTTMAGEQKRQTAAMRTCVELLDASTEHYENLALLRDELRQRDIVKKQHPPTIDLSSIEI
ncbi:uncharacterized protein LOC119190335 [Manduca sexta]|uniref:uncharacterized protein LOC119190335 n=1 Tax=Manduca sexta TaxID=7130 RepID=UPI00188EB8EE|nr:uncharacterized protein LOC119190335 [Manduca sexta]